MVDVLTDAGKAIITNRILGAGTEPKYIGWGTGGTGAAITDTTLNSEVAIDFTGSGTRPAGTSSRVTTTKTNDTYQVVGTLTAGGAGGTINNAGLFDINTPLGTGGLYIKSGFTGITLAAGDSIAFTFKHQVT